MSVMTRPIAPTRMRRTAEMTLLAVAVVLSILTMGGFTLVMNQIDMATFEEVVMPALLGGGDLAVDQAHEMARTLAAWFGASLVLMLLLSAAGFALARSRPHRRTAGWWLFAAGLVCLLGSQLVLFPLAFLYFLPAGLFALRPTPERSHG
ncbi:hypothetical protein CFK41_01745 [Brachybacterium ginsengisoli]|uniref:DUF4064 domain-containing protein n=1 Tax=Brachybacterium ginsengisoli TaxID=1331682 RepID=A0A291GTU2_9MICO|nr:DUF1772 domain-containing protein [Brachybacterium ginsengisoli]ATG53643.1 hypothetical protein CFK41_01745 [Brachybacterium ginsengisoli]